MHQAIADTMKRLQVLAFKTFTGTNRIGGRSAASKIACASGASFLEPRTKGLTKKALIKRTVRPAA